MEFKSYEEPVFHFKITIQSDTNPNANLPAVWESGFLQEERGPIGSRLGFWELFIHGFTTNRNTPILPRLHFQQITPGHFSAKPWRGYSFDLHMPYLDTLVLGIILEFVRRRFIKPRALRTGGFEVRTVSEQEMKRGNRKTG